MNQKVKTTLIWILVIFAIYAIITSPEKAAGILQNIVDMIVHALSSIGTFFSSLLN
jgi:hypothetical protein